MNLNNKVVTVKVYRRAAPTITLIAVKDYISELFVVNK
jgi:hypothetical protein